MDWSRTTKRVRKSLRRYGGVLLAALLRWVLESLWTDGGPGHHG
ncbi:hypothetical protein ACRYCC_00885 [Actinomadura scrupuli]